MPEQKLFQKSVFGGFNRDEVLKYIDEQSAQHNGEMHDIEDELASANIALDEKEALLKERAAQIAELTSVGDNMRIEYLKTRRQLDELTVALQKAKEELAAERQRSGENEKEIAILKEQNRILTEKAETDKEEAERLCTMAAKWDEAFNMLGASSERVLFDAKTKAETLIDSAESRAERINADVDGFRGEIGKLKEFMEETMAAISQRLDHIDRMADNTKISEESCQSHHEGLNEEYDELLGTMRKRIDTFKDPFFR